MATIEIRPLVRPGDPGWVVAAHGVTYAQEYGWDLTFELSVATIVGEFTPSPTDAAWIAELDGKRAGSVFCVREDETTARLRLMLVHPSARGQGIGRELVATCMRYAKAVGYQRVVLWTNDVLTSARKIYEAFGFELVDSEPHHSYGKDLVGQNWAVDLKD